MLNTASMTDASPWWQPGGHLQTIIPARFQTIAPVAYQRERWTTPDGDFIDLDWTLPRNTGKQTPLVILFHGLEGSSSSHYARLLMRACQAQTWQGVVVHFRGCSGEDNRLLRAYHSGDSAEIDWILHRLASSWPHGPRWGIGVSLGGNALAKWAGEQGKAAADLLNAGIAISAPLDLRRSGIALEKGFNRIYTWEFLRTLRRKGITKARRFPQHLDVGRIARCHTLREFDDAYTAPAHGFAGVDDYWRRASALPVLPQIRIPFLLLNARNDPFVPADSLPDAGQVASCVRLMQPQHGGHVGFAQRQGNAMASISLGFLAEQTGN
jgi:predicted alpha/beta-fold hydrolase